MKHSAMAVVSVMSAISSLAATQPAPAQAVEWRVADGGNGHWYRVIGSTAIATRDSAIAAATAIGVDLVSMGSEAEWGFVRALVDAADGADGTYGNFWLWTGGYKDAATNWTWRWGDGTSVNYFAWTPCAPNDPETGTLVIMVSPAWPCAAATTSWDDGSSGLWDTANSTGFVAEWSADCNNDGIVDYGQIKRGELPDYNGNNIPDCCEQGSACVVGSYPVQWRVEDGGNGHWYQGVLLSTNAVSWSVARTSAQQLAGDLASLSTASELQWVFGHVASSPRFWRGNFGPWVGGTRGAGTVWYWADGSPIDGSFPWAVGQPDNYFPCGGPENCTVFWPASASGAPQNLFADFPENGRCNEDGSTVGSAIIEWSADCNNDGLVDYGQILNGTLADANANGVPDTCESILLVPSQYPTIQAAIDAVPAGTHRTVDVAAGTYHESFALNGKDVIVRGAANNATILDGAGLAASIATLSGNEPATAGLEQLVFRNATVGTRIYPKALFLVGGAVYGLQSSAFIRSCRFESNRSDYGGGAYLLYCNMLVENCVFTQNTGVSQGGGLMTFGTTGTVRNCAFTDNRCGVAGAGSGSGFKSAGARIAGETVLLVDCTFTGGIAPVSGAAVEHYENTVGVPGILRISGCTITGNSSGLGAGGLNVIGGMYSCVLSGGTAICSNTTRNVDGPYLIEGSATVCDCLADITHDGAVSGGDLGVLLSNWGLTLPSGAGDVNHDGIVNAADLGALLSSWGACQ